MQRLEKSSKPEDREKATVLRQAIELASSEGVDTQFSKLVGTLTAQGITLREIEGAIGQNEQLLRTLREMISILLNDNAAAKQKEEAKRLQDLLKKLDAVIRSQKIERSKVESGKGDKDALAKSQEKVTKDTKDLAKARESKKPSDGKAGEPKTGEPKPGEPKPGEPKPGEPKPGEPKSGEPKSGEPKEGEPKPPEPNENEQSRKQVQDATENQKNAEERIKKDDRKNASGQQDEAIKKLEEARKEIERRLKQLREE